MSDTVEVGGIDDLSPETRAAMEKLKNFNFNDEAKKAPKNVTQKIAALDVGDDDDDDHSFDDEDENNEFGGEGDASTEEDEEEVLPKSKKKSNPELDELRETVRKQQESIERAEAAQRKQLAFSINKLAAEAAQSVEMIDTNINDLKRKRIEARNANDWAMDARIDDVLQGLTKDRQTHVQNHNTYVEHTKKLSEAPVAATQNPYMDKFLAEHPFFKPGDKNDAVSRFIDETSGKLVNEGYSQNGEALFKELRTRLRKKHPEVLKSAKPSSAFQIKGNKGTQVATSQDNGVVRQPKAGHIPAEMAKFIAMTGLQPDVAMMKRLASGFTKHTRGK